MQSSKQLHEKRGSLLREADVIIQSASRENRSISNSEDIRLERIKGEIFDVDSGLARIQTEIRTLTNEQDRFQISASGYSLTRAIRSAAAGRLDGAELEMSQELARRSGVTPSGFFIPSSLLAETRAMSVNNDSGSYGGKLVATEKLGFIDALRPLLAVGKAGAMILDGLTSNVDVPRQSAASTASWKSEIADLDESSPAISQMELRPRRVGSFITYSKQLLAQGSLDVETMIRMDLLQACATALDAAAINGTGADGQPTGILTTAGIGNVIGGTNGAAPTWAHIVALIASLEGQNVIGERTAFLINGQTAAKLRSTPKVSGTDSRMILEGNDLLGHPVFISGNVPSNLTKGTSAGVASAIVFGDFSHIVLGSFGQGIDLVVDGVTRAVQGQMRIVANSFVDVGVRRAQAFAAMKDALTA